MAEPLTIHSPEVKAAIARGDEAWVIQQIKEGNYQPLPGNWFRQVGGPEPVPAIPDPAAPVETADLNIHSPEVQAALARGDLDQVKVWMKEGRYEPLPGNRWSRVKSSGGTSDD